MASQTNTPASVLNQGSGDLSWVIDRKGAGRVELYANDQLSQSLTLTKFGFRIPPTAIITGVAVSLSRRAQHAETTNRILDAGVRLTLNGRSFAGSTQAEKATQWPSEKSEWIQYGHSSDLWGLTLSPSDVNSPNFGVGIQAQCTSSGAEGNSVATVYPVSVTVYFTIPVATPAMLLSDPDPSSGAPGSTPLPKGTPDCGCDGTTPPSPIGPFELGAF